jgi:hypothetical protein
MPSNIILFLKLLSKMKMLTLNIHMPAIYLLEKKKTISFKAKRVHIHQKNRLKRMFKA